MIYKDLGTTSSTFGYIEYLPPGYDMNTTKRYPLIVALHGVGSGGDGIYGATATGHLQSAAIGPMLIIKNDLAAGRTPYFGTNEVVVITPQAHSNAWFDPWEMNGFLTYLESAYRLDASRLYLTGLSMGGGRTWDYVRDYSGRLAAVIPICGASWNPTNADHFIGVSVWAFHNWDDATVSRTLTIDWARAISGALADYTADPLALYPHLSNNVNLPAANTMTGLFSSGTPGWTWEPNVVTNGDYPLRVTLYPSGGHGAWTKVYSNYNVWDWLLSQSQTPKVTGAPKAFTTNKTFQITLHVDRNYGFWSTNGSVFYQFTTSGAVITISRSTVLRYYGKDLLHVSGATNSISYGFDTNAPIVTGAPSAFSTNAPFTVTLDVNETYGYWSTNASTGSAQAVWNQFTTNGTSIDIENTTSLSVYGRDSLGNNSATNTYLYTLVVTPPAAPTNLTLQDTGAMALRLTWTDKSANENAFRIYRSTNGSSFAYIASAGANTAVYTDSSLSAGVTYWYKVSATNSGGESARTAGVSKQPAVILSLSNSAVIPRSDTRTLSLSYSMMKNCTNAAMLSIAYAAVSNAGVWIAVLSHDLTGPITLNTGGSFTNDWHYPLSMDILQRYTIRITAVVGTNTVSTFITNVSLSAPVKKLTGAVMLNNPCRLSGDAVITQVPENVVAVVYSVSGKRVAVVTPTDADRSAGRVTWDLTTTNGQKVVPGVYLCHLTSNSETIIVKIMVHP
ncbi:MAG: T9SS type A sorting domain-containing protein [Spirochaetes bacterium]|nr:T9SS type A sorting domain-containing protein [Spirochaetota bacterium]